ncbi:hypothetical protein O988_00518 [Pseudogymnoascus sp. VKM F-3808]|nr:hypothetical protein O988_00518 [Pseudogymnoascus sp. VKM F-3808]
MLNLAFKRCIELSHAEERFNRKKKQSQGESTGAAVDIVTPHPVQSPKRKIIPPTVQDKEEAFGALGLSFPVSRRLVDYRGPLSPESDDLIAEWIKCRNYSKINTLLAAAPNNDHAT